MTPSRPYLIRAMYDWIIDNGMTPHLLVDTKNEQVIVPRQYEEEGKIILNISTTAVQSLDLGQETVSFQARFDGEPMNVVVPIEYVLAIYTRENGQGMMFADDDQSPPPDDGSKDQSKDNDAKTKHPHLRVVK